MKGAVSREADRGGRSVEQLVTDDMSALGEHLTHTLQEKLGDSMVKSTRMEFVVTVPAIWSDLVKGQNKGCVPTSNRAHCFQVSHSPRIRAQSGG